MKVKLPKKRGIRVAQHLESVQDTDIFDKATTGFKCLFKQQKSALPSCGVERWWLRRCDGTLRSRNYVCKATASTTLGTRCSQPSWHCRGPTSLQKGGWQCEPSNTRKHRIGLFQVWESSNPQWQGRWQIHWLSIITAEHVYHYGIVSVALSCSSVTEFMPIPAWITVKKSTEQKPKAQPFCQCR